MMARTGVGGHSGRSFKSRLLQAPVFAGTMLAAALPSVASAQTAPAPATTTQASDTADIVVTATKRSESVQDIPLSVTAISTATLERSGATSFDDYAAFAPNLSFGYSATGRQTSRNFALRGISGTDTSALYIGETPVDVSVDPRVIDLQRVEVLRGPQGSLFGARSMGGLVRLIPVDPDTTKFSGRAHVGYGAVNEGASDYRADATLNIPLSDKAAFRITGYYLHDGGFIDRLIDPDGSDIIQPTAASVPFTNGDERLHKNINSGDTYGVQAALKVELTDWLTITPRVMYQSASSDGPNYVDNSITNLVKVRQFDVSELGRDRWVLPSLEIEADVGIGTIVSSTSYYDRRTRDVEDSTRFIASRAGGRVRAAVAAPATTSATLADRRFTQETRFVSNFGGRFDLIAGVFYQHIDREADYPPESIVPVGSPLINIFGTGIAVGDSFFSLAQNTKSSEVGLFGEATYKITPKLKFTAGGRWYNVDTTNRRQDGGVLYTKLYGITPVAFSGSSNDSGFNPRFALTWEPAQSTTLYANVAKGFRPGAANLGASVCRANGFTNVPDVVKSDSLWNYELGIKNNLFGGRVTTDLSVYKIVWKNRRTTVVGDCGLGFGYADNVGEAQSEGFEFDLAATIVKGIKFQGDLGYTNSRITNNGGIAAVVVGSRLADVPYWNGSAALDFDHKFADGLTGYGRIDYRYVGPSTSAQRNPRPEYSLVNLRAGVKFDRFDIAVYATNLFDKRANLSDPPELSDSLNLIAVNRPRTIGVDLRTNF